LLPKAGVMVRHIDAAVHAFNRHCAGVRNHGGTVPRRLLQVRRAGIVQFFTHASGGNFATVDKIPKRLFLSIKTFRHG
jgi:hypothetical protein